MLSHLKRKRDQYFLTLDGDYSCCSEKDPEEEMMRYISEPVMIKNPLKWWDHYAGRFPTLAKLARKFLCIMGTSVPSERVFSVAGLTVTKTRSRLDSEVVNEIIFMNKILHKRFKDASTKEEIKQDPDGEQSAIVSDQSEPHLPALY